MSQKKKNYKTILAIETSCDDTSIGIIQNHKIVANVTRTKFEDHKNYGGIIPEYASRKHAKHLNPLLNYALSSAQLKYSDLDYVAYTSHPGLVGCLHTGKVFAKTLSYLLDKPLIKVNHMIGHAFSFCIDNQKIVKVPFLCLDASGGHTIIYLFNDYDSYLLINQTHDDAIGETLDKVGRMLELPYPGGISIDKIYDEKKATLPLIKHYEPTQSFSFSGIKTYMTNMIHNLKQKKQAIDKVTIASSFLKWCVDELIIKVKHYLKCYKVNYLVVAGGVAANSALRKALSTLKSKVYVAEKKYCGDNAAMIANYADLLLSNKK